jgi:hypothetical protein
MGLYGGMLIGVRIVPDISLKMRGSSETNSSGKDEQRVLALKRRREAFRPRVSDCLTGRFQAVSLPSGDGLFGTDARQRSFVRGGEGPPGSRWAAQVATDSRNQRGI